MGKCQDDTRDNQKVIFSPIEEQQYKAELDLLDRFHFFSAELLRLSLIGIAVFLQFYVEALKDGYSLLYNCYEHDDLEGGNKK
jgi:hypothetical protein